MKNNLRTIIILAALGAVLSCAATGFAQVKTGSYKRVSNTDATVVAAADYAVDAESKKDDADITLESIESAGRQTVAGANYQLCLQVKVETNEADDDGTRFIQAVVFYSLKREFTLKTWAEIETCGAEEK